MIYLTGSELIPDALEEGGRSLTAWGGVMVGKVTRYRWPNPESRLCDV